ncbi:MAG: DUF1501 domain-containing protein [Planctomycetota bacterium]
MSTRALPKSDDLTRRDFVAASAWRLLGLAACPSLARIATAQDPVRNPAVTRRPALARRVIYLYMSGGMSQLDTFDPKPGAETQGPTEAIRTSADDVLIAANFRAMAPLMDRVAVLSAMTSTQGAHEQGRYFLHTSYALRGTIRHPSLGAWLSHMAGSINGALPPHVAIAGDIYSASGGFLHSRHFPLPIGDPEAGLQHGRLPRDVPQGTFHRRLSRLQQMNDAFEDRYRDRAMQSYGEMYDQAIKLMGSQDLAAFDLAKEPDWIRDAYGRDEFGQGCLLARRLIEHDVRFVEVVSGGWDTHNDNFDELDEKAPQLDRSLAALLADLEARGLLEDTLVVLATEFGRTPDIVTERMGRNHFPKAFTCLLAGAGVRGGQRYGKTDATGREILENPVSIPDFNATIAWALGLPLDHVETSPSGRPFHVADKGRPMTGLFA